MTDLRPLIALMLLSACGRSPQQQAAVNQPAPVPVNETTAAMPANVTAPPREPPLAESKGAIDPKSAEAAGQVVQHYGALIEQNRFGEATKLWSDANSAAAFAKQLHPFTHLNIGKLDGTEGAAGSIYTTVPVIFYGDTFSRPAEIILRRVNDVPGSTEEQRRWHIERIDWKPAG